MPHAIIRGENGRRHEVEFGDAPVRVQIYASEETVEIFIEADSETLPEEPGVSPFSTFSGTCLVRLPPSDVRNPLISRRGLRQVGPLLTRMMGRLPRETRLCHPAESRIADLRLATRPMAACCASKYAPLAAATMYRPMSPPVPRETPRPLSVRR